ncbi:hypothetical protein [Micromonospora robiginosa]|uniref:Uncharacterized protein n=1 Tax=Micromonospora robiginosa TaxID=2749844 RepID=A0A7L6B7I7_9ACTN|nr:hypothetical protein [Micromonospora ferruginea]QLQ37845.1 hypothetical protein H1D33_02810 [Micromonospora ferruginea]
MAFRTWGRLLLTALGVSVLAGAGQLGIAYGFGVVRLDGAFVDGSVNRWPAQLVWVAWFAAVAAVAGAVLTERFARRDDRPGGTTELLSVAGVSALGAIVVAPLCMQPARAAELGGSVDPVWAAGICAVLGAVVGAGAAIAVLLKPPFGWGVALSAGIVWLLALLSVAPAIVSNRPLATVRLGVLEPSWLDAGAAQRLAMLLLPTLALLAGGAIGVLARRAGHPPLVGGAAGAAGPVLVAFAYLTAGPGAASDRYQVAPYYGALIAIVAGALGSTATTVLPRPATGADAVEPTDILAPLPTGAPVPAGVSAPAVATTTPATPGAPAPAHWDWPEAGGSATAPAAARHAAPASPTAPDSPDPHPAAPAPARDGEGSAHGSPMPNLLPPGRRTSAIDVLSAGRPEPQPAAGATPSGDDTPGPGIAAPAPSDAGTPAGSSRPAVDAAGPVGRTAGRPTPEPRTSPEEQATGTEPSAAPSTVEATPRATRPRRSRTAARATSPADDRTPTGTAAAATDGPTSGAAAPGDAPAPDAPVTDADDTTATTRAGRARRTRAPRTTRSDTAPATAPRPDDTSTPGETTTSAAPTVATSAPAGGTSTPASATSGPTSATATPTTATSGPTSDTSGPTSAASGPTSDTSGPTSAASGPTSAASGPTSAASGPAGDTNATTSGTATPADGTSAPTADGTSARTTGPSTRAAGDTSVPLAGDADASGESRAVKPAGRRSFFFDPEPADRSASSPRPRFPIFEDVTERPGDVRPAWPITPAAGRPPRPLDAPAPTEPATGRDRDDTTARAEPAPRPRHQGLPEPGRSTGWDALATGARPAGRPAPEVTGPTPAADATVPTQAGPATAADPEPARGRHAGADEAEAAGGKAKARRGLFRRNRGKDEPEQVDETAQPSATGDDEYVDWVAGLASDDNADDARSLRTGRHHRD